MEPKDENKNIYELYRMDFKQHKEMMLDCFMEILENRTQRGQIKKNGSMTLLYTYINMRQINDDRSDEICVWIPPNTVYYDYKYGENPLDLFKEDNCFFLFNRTDDKGRFHMIKHTKYETSIIHIVGNKRLR